MKGIRICQWALIEDGGLMFVRGKVFNHPVLKNGSVTVVEIVDFDLGNGMTETVAGAKYLLGAPARL
jgi:hypothetical protein